MTFRQKRFVEAFLGEARGNAAEAARLAGYKSPKQQGYRLRRDPAVAALIQERLDELTLSNEEILARYSDQARGIGPYLEVRDIGIQQVINVDMDRLKRDGLGHLVKSVKWSASGRQSIEFYDAQTALAQLAKMRNLIVDKCEITGPGGGPIEVQVTDLDDCSDEELRERLARASGLLVAGALPEES